MIINNSTGKIIHTQRNNRIKPYSSCNVTSFINALKCSDIDFYYPKDMQPEDYFMKLMQSENAWKLYVEKAGLKLKNSSNRKIYLCKPHYTQSNKLRKIQERNFQKKGFLDNSVSHKKGKWEL